MKLSDKQKRVLSELQAGAYIHQNYWGSKLRNSSGNVIMSVSTHDALEKRGLIKMTEYTGGAHWHKRYDITDKGRAALA